MTIYDFAELLGNRLAAERNHTSTNKHQTAGDIPCCICDGEKYWIQGQTNGWLDAYDVEGRDAALERRTAAKILHVLLRQELQEADETDWGEAVNLLDLYDCRVCVNHVAQVYAKGIMEGIANSQDKLIFGMREIVTKEQAVIFIERLFDKSKRLRHGHDSAQEYDSGDYSVLSLKEAAKYFETCIPGRLFDVRSEDAYLEQHIDGAVLLPLSRILDNPQIPGENKDDLILLYCDAGYQSEIAANCLREAGYRRVIAFRTEHDTSSNKNY